MVVCAKQLTFGVEVRRSCFQLDGELRLCFHSILGQLLYLFRGHAHCGASLNALEACIVELRQGDQKLLRSISCEAATLFTSGCATSFSNKSFTCPIFAMYFNAALCAFFLAAASFFSAAAKARAASLALSYGWRSSQLAK